MQVLVGREDYRSLAGTTFGVLHSKRKYRKQERKRDVV